jgi:glycine C-acetyltransferase
MLRPISSAHTVTDPADDRRMALLHLLGGAVTQRPDHVDPARLTRPGLNFATQDYLALGQHPAIRAAALAALGQHRLVAPGPAPRLGLTAPVLALEDRIAAFLTLPAALAFPSGSEAIRLTLRTLLSPGDEIIVDLGCHPAVVETVLLAQARLHRSPSGSVEGVERRLSRLARQPRRGKLIIVVPAVSAHASRVAELDELSALARQHGATLIADVTHDLGAMAPCGGGVMEIQSCLGRVDIVLGSFAKSFAASGGFAAFRDPALKADLLQSQWRTTALSPVNASVILAALDLISGPEGKRRRRNLHGIALRLRNHLMADGVKVMGKASPFFSILLPTLTALPRTALLESAGPLVTLLQTPSVPAHAPRWRIQLTADHSPADIDDLAELIRDVSRAFDRQPVRSRVPA